MTRYVAELAGRDGVELRHIEAASEREVAQRLLSEGFTPLRISSESSAWLARLNQPLGASAALRTRELALFSAQLSAMLEGGLPLDQALGALAASRSNSPARRVAKQLVAKVREGLPLSRACESTRVFPAYYAGVLHASEHSGRLPSVLSQLASHFEELATTRAAVATGMTYPVIVLVSTLASLLFVLSFVIPEFAAIFSGETKRLPWITNVILAASSLVTDHGAVMLLCLAAFAACAMLAWRRADPKRKLRWAETFTRRVPFLELRYQFELARTLKVLGMMLNNGVNAAEALAYCKSIELSEGLSVALRRAATRIREGHRLSEVLATLPRIPETSIRLVEVGERTAALGTSLERAAHLLERECRTTLNRLLAVLNPLAIVVLGALVALVISGVMLGILSINQIAFRG